MEIRQWLGFQGRVNRATYALVGVFGVLLKHNLDRLLALKLFHQHWNVLSYFSPLGILHNPNALVQDQKKFLLTLALTSIPFIWIGIGMTLRRLCDAGLDTLLVLLFFVPVVNVLFFVFLCAVPSHEEALELRVHQASFLSAVLPKSKFGISAFSSFASGLVGVLLSWASIRLLGNYGWTLFLAIPFFMGFLAAWLFCYRQTGMVSFGNCAGVAVLASASPG
ncbi:MAG TPA: DUF805 domain-containing protein [Candidatus Acidoferrum sp.]|jgi:uncharacterized membrane protein YhaH (DUF805 family)